ncbi:MAG: 3-methyl-2-oxobutanoate dehydrogenase subunit VorB [Deltaproteobacteria bacterium]|nr:MAG: 3-methyl-2-oxobutanoate dehydrogenase subunit VorB [Deltaproteobacteria bacterium]
MEPKELDLVKGNEALAMGAIDAGCRLYFGYPITPQNDIPEYLSKHLPLLGGEFIQAESEIASINMVLGAGATGTRAMTSSSGPGISLMQEGISYMAGSELPGVIVNISRSGPGLGGIAASQADYFQATRGGGHGDYRVLVLAPCSVQEMYDLTIRAFALADKYRNPTLILGDAIIGQMKEPLVRRTLEGQELPKEWALRGAKGRKRNILKSLYLGEGELTQHVWKLHQKYERMKEEIVYEAKDLQDAQLVVVAFGSVGRVAKTATEMVRQGGYPAGLIRPISLFPFPEEIIWETSKRAKDFLTIELNTGQMVEDVRLSVTPDTRVHFYGKPPGSFLTPEETAEVILSYMK